MRTPPTTHATHHLILLGQLTPLPQHMPIFEHDKRNQTQHRSKTRQNQPRILTPDVVEKRIREQRRHSPQRVPHESLACNGTRRVRAVAIGRITVRALEHKVDAERDRRETDRGAHPREVAVLRERVDEEADG